jgi:hypothetical protein
MPVVEVKTYLGHKSLSSMMSYVEVDERQANASAQAALLAVAV